MARGTTHMRKAPDSTPKPAITTAFCNRCGGQTDHDIMYAHEDQILHKELQPKLPRKAREILNSLIQTGDDPDLPPPDKFTVRFEVLRCRGCRTVIGCRREYPSYIDAFGVEILRDVWGSEVDSFYGVAQYPPAMARRAPPWIASMAPSTRKLPKELAALMKEIYQALQNVSRRLVAMGIRAALDQVLTNKVGDRGNFRQKLSALQASDFISGKQKDILYRIIDAGSGSVHREWRPSDLDIGVLLDITENIIETIYLHDARSEAVHKKVPKRVTRDRPIPGAEKTYH